MNCPTKGAAGSYARVVERLWSELCGRAVILSPRDWSIIKGWYGRGIPLQIIEEAVEAAAERRKSGKQAPPPRGLAYIARAVEEGWMAVLEGRTSGGDEGPPVDVREASPISGWQARLEGEAEGSALRALLSELVEAFERGEEAAELERALDSRLPGVVPEELLRAVELELERELAPYRERMASGAWEATLQRALAMRLRQRLRLDGL